LSNQDLTLLFFCSVGCAGQQKTSFCTPDHGKYQRAFFHPACMKSFVLSAKISENQSNPSSTRFSHFAAQLFVSEKARSRQANAE